MFEQPLELEPQSKKGIWIAAALIIVLAVAVVLLLRSKGSTTSKTAAAEAHPAAVANQKADPAHDLQVVSAQMQKDSSGTVATWVVDIHNLSPVYTYSAISYQTTYAGADNQILSQNTGVIPVTIGPNGEQTAQFSDVQYPTGTSWYRFQVVNAKSQSQ
ncbi:MAG: hypothetical protein KGL59_01270 [Acidobacteriota bacterium]|nr:hypothetical protein [Acidobacteriota bacterium]